MSEQSQFSLLRARRFAPFFATQVMRVMAERLRNANQLVTPIEDI